MKRRVHAGSVPMQSAFSSRHFSVRRSIRLLKFEIKENAFISRPWGANCPWLQYGRVMDVFAFRDFLVKDYERFTRSFVRIRAEDIKRHVDGEYAAGRFWPAPMIQLNPAFVPGGDVGQFVAEGLLHPECERIFRFGKTEDGAPGKALTLHKHQEEAIRIAVRA